MEGGGGGGDSFYVLCLFSCSFLFPVWASCHCYWCFRVNRVLIQTPAACRLHLFYSIETRTLDLPLSTGAISAKALLFACFIFSKNGSRTKINKASTIYEQHVRQESRNGSNEAVICYLFQFISTILRFKLSLYSVLIRVQVSRLWVLPVNIQLRDICESLHLLPRGALL